jgi:Cd2+/Zn2+-exporting ATPase
MAMSESQRERALKNLLAERVARPAQYDDERSTMNGGDEKEQRRGGQPSRETRTTLCVPGVCCPTEVPIIEAMLEPLPGILKVAVNVPNRTAIVDHDASQSNAGDLVLALASLGARIHSTEEGLILPKWNVFACGLFFAVSLMVSSSSFGEGNYVLDAPLSAWRGHQNCAAIAGIVVGWPPILQKAWGALKHKVLDVNLLMSCAVIGAICIGEYLEGTTIVFLFALGEWLEDRATEKAREAIGAVIALKPEQAVLKETGTPIPTDAVLIGTVVMVRPGEKIPIDGVVHKGASTIDQAAITGESTPTKKIKGDEVLAGTVNQSGFLEICTTKLSRDSAAARLVRLIEDAQAQRSPTELIVDRFASLYTPVIFLMAFLMATVPWFVFDDTEYAEQMVYNSLVLLVTACPCALVISTPLVYVCALAMSARKGILVKGGSHLETLGRLHTLAIDKTGTLTEGRFHLVHLLLSADPMLFSRKAVLSLVAGAENCSSHPLAAAIVKTAQREGLAVPSDVIDYETIQGEGISATVSGKQVQIGNRRMADKHGWIVPPKGDDGDSGMLSAATDWEAEANTVCWVAIDGVLTAVLGVADKIRDEAKEAISLLKTKGVRIVMLTGDNEGTARAVQRQLGLDEVHARLLPEEKVEFVSKLKLECPEGRTVAMVGDGINDAPALSRADVGIAMGVGGSAAAMETADVALMDSSLLKLAKAQAVGMDCLTKIRQNVVLALVSKLFMVVLAARGFAPLWLAIVADVGAMLIVCINGMRLLYVNEEYVHATAEQAQCECSDDFHDAQCAAEKAEVPCTQQCERSNDGTQCHRASQCAAEKFDVPSHVASSRCSRAQPASCCADTPAVEPSAEWFPPDAAACFECFDCSP